MTNSQIRENLLKNIRGDRIPNAICIIDSGGRGSLQLASKLGLSIVDNPTRSVNRSIFVHPDLHYIYPTKKPEKREEKHFNKKMNAFYSDKWREFMSTLILGSFDEWLDFSSSSNKPGEIRVGQISEMISLLNLKPFQSDKKACIIWGLDYINANAANRLLKVLEEPPKQTYFILIAKDQAKILPTIASRCQVIRLPPLEHEGLKRDLKKWVPDSSGSSKERERLFIDCLRGCYLSAIRKDFSQLLRKSDEIGSLNKSDIRDFFSFGIRFIRQIYFYSKRINELYTFKFSNDFSIDNFAPYVNDRNYNRLISLFDINLRHINRNANSKLLITSFLLELSDILYIVD